MKYSTGRWFTLYSNESNSCVRRTQKHLRDTSALILDHVLDGGFGCVYVSLVPRTSRVNGERLSRQWGAFVTKNDAPSSSVAYLVLECPTYDICPTAC
jgi:hypothetical protein